MNIVKNLVDESKYSIKCPYEMKPTRIVVHNTANDASAKNEVTYMKRNDYEKSFHYAVDDKQVVQAIPEYRNAWHSGDGGNGRGNREGIAIEICYSKSGGAKFDKAEQNAVELIVDILKRYGWGIDKVTKHQDYNGKYCPHRTLDLGWERFIKMVDTKLNPPKKTVEELAKEVMAGMHGNGHDARRKSLAAQGYNNYDEVRAKVNELYGAKTTTAPKVNYFPKYNGNSASIAYALATVGAKSTYAYRKEIAKANNIKLYVGTAKQNTTMLNLLKQGKLIKP
jgi:N-acetylmuramoyl-L-alanine amidase CwlA